MRCPRSAWSLPWEPLLVYLPFFALAAVFGRLSAAALDALLDVEADTFVTLPLLSADAVGLLAFPTGSDTFTTADEWPRPFFLS
jgi:hypothetical protein